MANRSPGCCSRPPRCVEQLSGYATADLCLSRLTFWWASIDGAVDGEAVGVRINIACFLNPKRAGTAVMDGPEHVGSPAAPVRSVAASTGLDDPHAGRGDDGLLGLILIRG
jgi:hypothetical protein